MNKIVTRDTTPSRFVTESDVVSFLQKVASDPKKDEIFKRLSKE